MRFSHHPPLPQTGLHALLTPQFRLTLSPIHTHNRISLSPPSTCTPEPLHVIPSSYTQRHRPPAVEHRSSHGRAGQPHDYGFLIRAVEHRSCKKRMRVSSSNYLCIPMPIKPLSPIMTLFPERDVISPSTHWLCLLTLPVAC
jgi:hypothetical protein